jgi:hypothetical protein
MATPGSKLLNGDNLLYRLFQKLLASEDHKVRTCRRNDSRNDDLAADRALSEMSGDLALGGQKSEVSPSQASRETISRQVGCS